MRNGLSSKICCKDSANPRSSSAMAGICIDRIRSSELIETAEDISEDGMEREDIMCQAIRTDSSTSSSNSVQNDLPKVEILDYFELKDKNQVWVSEIFSTNEGYKFCLHIRPNGLRYTAGFNKCVGIWFKPMPGENDSQLPWPAKVNLSLWVQNVSGSSVIDGLVIDMKEYTWKREDTRSINPAFKLNLTALRHNAIEEGCIINDGGRKSIIIVIEEGQRENFLTAD